jgi:hypothetical protein
MRQTPLALAIIGFFLASLGFLSNWWTSRFDTHYGPTLGLLTNFYGVAALLCAAIAVWAAWPRKPKL